jgi:hypothetical protein
VSAEPTPPLNQTVTDYVTIVLSPVLIMGLVGSLVFFLLEVLYRAEGPWKDRLQWIFFFFVFGIVLTARISMNDAIGARAPLYGAILALLTYIGMQIFVEYPNGLRELSFLVNLVLLALVWWCAHRLTWDCTNVDEDADMSGEGLLQAAGLEEGKPAPDEEEVEVTVEQEGPTVKRRPGWWERFQKYREEKKKKRTLGVWVVYFSLAALPLFGLGQSLIPLTAPGRRRFAFWLMTVYVGCGLGLLLTTCFLGLRRYLRQKRLQMPAAMTGMWLTVGGSLVAALLLVGAFLPRPYSEYPLLDVVGQAGSVKRKANRLAFKGDSPAEGKGQPGEGKPGGKEGAGKTGEKGQGQGEGKDKDGKGGKGEGKDGKGGSPSSSGKSEGEKGDGKGEQGKGEQGKGEQGKGEQGKGEQGKNGEQGRGEKGEKKDGGRQGRSDPGNAAKGMKDMEKGQQGGGSPSSPSRLARLQQVVQRVAPVLKWLVFGVLALLVLAALLRGGLGFLANFTDWAKRLQAAWRSFWANLFRGTPPQQASPVGEEATPPKKPRGVPFRAFSNPFDTGEAERMTLRNLVRYSFEALEAWARDHELGRREDETALEFVRRLNEEIPSLESASGELARLHSLAEYGQERLPDSTLETMRGFWERLQRVAEAPLSA